MNCSIKSYIHVFQSSTFCFGKGCQKCLFLFFQDLAAKTVLFFYNLKNLFKFNNSHTSGFWTHVDINLALFLAHLKLKGCSRLSKLHFSSKSGKVTVLVWNGIESIQVRCLLPIHTYTQHLINKSTEYPKQPFDYRTNFSFMLYLKS